jgi:beta-galactosidase
MEKLLRGDKILLGTCYYPEHWEEGLWKDDLARMKKNGITVIRIAEFAWNKIEPTEGNYTFDFFDRFLETAKEADMSVIFCTPTATPPAWLTHQYPEVLNARMDGTLFRHGGRRHYNYNSLIYRRFTEKIVEKIAAHYGHHPAIIGWQIDNEINCETDEFYSESDTIAFREFLKNKYTTLDSLNAAWGTVFWNQTYTAWAEVFAPCPTANNSVNPHRVFDYIRFVSDSACGFVNLQSDIIRKYKKPGDFITTNGIFPSLDNHLMTRESLDFITYDSYPNFAYGLETGKEHSADLKDRKWSRNLSDVRSISGIFGIMEPMSTT